MTEKQLAMLEDRLQYAGPAIIADDLKRTMLVLVAEVRRLQAIVAEGGRKNTALRERVAELEAGLKAVLEAHENEISLGGQVYTDALALRALLGLVDEKHKDG